MLTPDLKACGVAGIVRAEILKHAASMGLEAKVQRIEHADVLAADEAFFTNSIIGVWPVRRAGDHKFAGADFAHRLAHALVDAGCIAPA